LVSDLSSQINDRNNDPDSAEHLSDRANHSRLFMSDETNPNHQNFNIQRPTRKLFWLEETTPM
jgi:hypothetical protein